MSPKPLPACHSEARELRPASRKEEAVIRRIHALLTRWLWDAAGRIGGGQ